ncbi:MBL fold metallo-hydrolase [Solihabitans fulvus]|uniref:MBL fold metallo-hydrolase n=1 Tax=Solihabitans fulvus TaxID=1892852 RepID=A0A5B2XIC2_9PSEU|nr:MBL fold metallo-hydrolase [Solihabitans fulvus]KAA2262986.1 MBL fold metallo-hydrolase [Solihabitans fulvus]
MLVHHVNCGTMRPFGGRLVDGEGSILSRATMVCHCLVIETDQGLVLVDTGIGLTDMLNPPGSLGRQFATTVRPVFDPAESMARQVVALGHKVEDVRHIVLTHLDLDHAGGLAEFPQAKVHVFAEELHAANNPTNALERARYRSVQWAHDPDWVTHRVGDGERWFGFEAVRELPGLPPEILMIPLAGHTRGHAGVAVHTGDRWLLHAGDAYFFHGEKDPVRPHCTPVLTFFQNRMDVLRSERLANQERLRELMRDHDSEVDMFSAHSVQEFRERTTHAVR